MSRCVQTFDWYCKLYRVWFRSMCYATENQLALSAIAIARIDRMYAAIDDVRDFED